MKYLYLYVLQLLCNTLVLLPRHAADLSGRSSSQLPTTSARQERTEGVGSQALWASAGKASLMGLGEPYRTVVPRAW